MTWRYRRRSRRSRRCSVEKLLIKMEPKDLGADNDKDLDEDKNTEETKKLNWKLNR